MSLSRIKMAFNRALRQPGGDRFTIFLEALVQEAGGEVLHVYVPTRVRDKALDERRRHMFKIYHDAGMSIREIANVAGIPKDSVRRLLAQSCTGSATAA